MHPDYIVRPMRPDDVEAVEELTAEAFLDVDRRTHRVDRPEPARRPPEQARAWVARTHHLVTRDGPGCFVADTPQGLIGVVASARRDLTWIVATFAVRPRLHGRGVGRQLLAAAAAYGRGCLRAMVSAGDDPLAVRSYRQAGFSLHPTMEASGMVARSALPVVERVREGGPGDADLMDSVDRRVRDAAHGPDHALLATQLRLVVVDRPAGSGYAYVEPNGGPYLLAATSRRVAAELLWETLAASDPDVPCAIRHLTAANEWALDVGLAARMPFTTSGYLGLRGMRPPMPYLPSGHFV